jgi:hypothetical protein
MATLQALIWEVLEHPASSSFLSPDFHLFRPLREALRSWKIAVNDAMKEAVSNWIYTESKTCYCQSF